jgi:HlyD family secretion protein
MNTEHPGIDMDREIPENIRRKRRIRTGVKIAIPVLVLIISLCTLSSVISPSVDRADIITSVAERGAIDATVTGSGKVVPAYEQVISSPIAATIDSIFINHGQPVLKGQSVLRLDNKALMIQYQKVSEELELKRNKKQQLILGLKQSQEELKANLDIKELQVRFLQSQLEREKQLFEIGASNQTRIDQAQLNLEIARRELDLLNTQQDNRRSMLEADLREIDLEIRIYENNLAEKQRMMELSEATADRDGIVTWINDNIGATVNPGDPLARVADLKSFQIEAKISDIHVNRVSPGGRVWARIGKTQLGGTISRVQPAVENGTVSFTVELDNPSHEVLRPNLRVDVFVITSTKIDVIRVKNGPFYDGLVDQSLFVVKGDRAVRHTVSIGESNFDYVEIVGDIEPGDEVIISDMSDYRHMDEVKIED